MEQARHKVINDEINNIKLQNGELITTSKPSAISLFQNESSRIKRGYDIFNISDNDWTNVATISKNNLSYDYFVSKLVEYVDDLDITLYENGVLLNQEGDYKLIVISEFSSNNTLQFSVLCNYPVLPCGLIGDISSFGNFVNECYEMQPKTGKAISDDVIGLNGFYSIDTFVYSNTSLDYEKAMDNVYHISISDNTTFDKLNNLPAIESYNMDEFESAKVASEQLLQGKTKALK